jgi:hypothetical protein
LLYGGGERVGLEREQPAVCPLEVLSGSALWRFLSYDVDHAERSRCSRAAYTADLPRAGQVIRWSGRLGARPLGVCPADATSATSEPRPGPAPTETTGAWHRSNPDVGPLDASLRCPTARPSRVKRGAKPREKRGGAQEPGATGVTQDASMQA